MAVESVVNSNFLLNFHEEFKKICFLYENLIIIHISKSITNLSSSKKLYYISILIEVGYMYEYITCTLEKIIKKQNFRYLLHEIKKTYMSIFFKNWKLLCQIYFLITENSFFKKRIYSLNVKLYTHLSYVYKVVNILLHAYIKLILFSRKEEVCINLVLLYIDMYIMREKSRERAMYV